MKEMIKNAMILLTITVIAGFVLGFVYQNTKGPIAASNEKAKKEASMEVFLDAAEFKDAELNFDEKQIQLFKDNGYEENTVDEVQIAFDQEQKELGYVITVTSTQGYGGDIQFLVGIRMDGTVNGISILSISETAGLGMEAEKVLKPQFQNKQVDEFTYTKTGSTSDQEIDAISGATITTNAFTNGVNAALFYFNHTLTGGGSNE